MKAWTRDRYGSPDVLRLEELPEPVPTGDEVVVRVRAASVNRADLDYLYGVPAIARMGTGIRRPRNARLGLDVAGVVEAVGPEAVRLQPGDQVFGDLTQHGYGAFAEVACASEKAFAPMPSGASFEQAATVPQSGVLALQGLKKAHPVKAGDHVLVNGASGNVGPFAVQLAKAMGAEVTGVCSTAKMEFVRSIGADHVIDYMTDDYVASGERYDRIVDVVGRHSMLAIRRALKPGGVYAWIGGSAFSFVQIVTLAPLLSLLGSRKMGLFMWQPMGREEVATLSRLMEDGSIRPVIDRRYPLEEVPQALRDLEAGHAMGKLVVDMGGADVAGTDVGRS